MYIIYIYMYIKHYERFITRERKEFSLHNCIYNSALHSTLISLTDNKFSIVRSEYIRLRKISRENETNAKNSSRLSSLSTNITVTNFYCWKKRKKSQSRNDRLWTNVNWVNERFSITDRKFADRQMTHGYTRHSAEITLGIYSLPRFRYRTQDSFLQRGRL